MHVKMNQKSLAVLGIAAFLVFVGIGRPDRAVATATAKPPKQAKTPMALPAADVTNQRRGLVSILTMGPDWNQTTPAIASTPTTQYTPAKGTTFAGPCNGLDREARAPDRIGEAQVGFRSLTTPGLGFSEQTYVFKDVAAAKQEMVDARSSISCGSYSRVRKTITGDQVIEDRVVITPLPNPNVGDESFAYRETTTTTFRGSCTDGRVTSIRDFGYFRIRAQTFIAQLSTGYVAGRSYSDCASYVFPTEPSSATFKKLVGDVATTHLTELESLSKAQSKGRSSN